MKHRLRSLVDAKIAEVQRHIDDQVALAELGAEDTTVAARFRCQGTHTGTWQGLPPTGRTMRIDEVYFFRFGVGDGGDLAATRAAGGSH